jgi:hypothetical protein
MQRQNGSMARPTASGGGSEYKAGFGLRLWAIAVFGAIAGVAFFFGLDEDSDFPEEGAYIVLAVCVIAVIAIFLQQMKNKVVLKADGLEKLGLSGKQWEMKWMQMQSISFDPTQGGFPLGTGLAIVDRAGHRVTVPKSIGNIQELGRRVLDQHAKMNLGEMLLLLEHGDDIRFGDAIMVNRDLMRAPDPQTNHLVDYSLRDFRGAMVKQHALEITLAGKPVPLKIKLKELPNAHLLQPILTKAKALGPKQEIVLAVSHDQLEKTEH